MFKNIAFVSRRELRYILGNRRLLLILCFVPVLYLSLFGVLYSKHVVKDIRLAVLDQNQTALSRSVVQAFRDSEKFDIRAYPLDEQELTDMIDNKEVEAAVVIPQDLTRDVKLGHGSKVLVIVNGTNMLFSNSVVNAANEIIQTLSGGITIQTLEGRGFLPDKAQDTAVPLSFRLRVWYNPTFNYTNFLLLGLACTALQQVALLYMAVAITREKEHGTLGELQAAGIRPAETVLGKILPYFAINFITMNVALLLSFTVFEIPFRGNYLYILLLVAVFLACILSLGIMLSSICRNELEATQIAMLLAVPSFLFSGYTWPIQSMPGVAKAISYALPLTYLATNVREIALMNIGLDLLLPHIGILLLMTAVFLPLSILFVRAKHLKPKQS